jgi:hypothetical protein
MTETASWTLLLALGAFHGINPGMGWLFAVALGMQERRRSAVWRALLPLGLGHALAVAAAIAVAVAIGVAVPTQYLRWLAAAFLGALGVYRLYRHRHPRSVGMRVGAAGLTWWSFLMASAHGAGLMVVPVFLGMAMVESAGGHAHHGAAAGASQALMATSIHAAAYLLVTAAIAVVVFEKLGVGLLRKAWINLDLIWAATLIATGCLTLLL